MYSTGQHTAKEIAQKIQKKYKNHQEITTGKVMRILNTKFYYGIMIHYKKYYPHIYDIIITKDLFEKCRKIREKNRYNRL